MKKKKIVNTVVIVVVLIIFALAIIYIAPVMKDIATKEGQIA